MLYLIASSVEGPWWDLWKAITSHVSSSNKTKVDKKLEIKSVMFYIEIAVESTLTLILMFAQAFLLPKVYAWADA